MYYEVYVDILFLENLWMDAELLVLTAKLFRKPLHAGRILAAAIAGSLGACLLTIGSEWISKAGCFLGSLFLAVLMTAIAFGREKHFRLTVAGLYLECFLMGGFLRYADQFYRLNGMVFLMAGSVAGVVLSGLETLILEKKKEEQRVCRAVLICGSCQLELEGLLDTGNGLTDPVSRSPVSLVDRAYMELLLKGDRTERIPRMIPYQTISQKGILTAYRIDIMKIRNLSETVEIQKPWIAVMPQSAGRYPLILHRDLLSS